MHGARQAGLSVAAKAVQLWQVGAGLPLDALKKGAISVWACPYKLGVEECAPLLDALSKNSSLVHLDLVKSGIRFHELDANGYPLVEAMNKGGAALSGLATLTISASSGYVIPIGRMRAGKEEALSALRASKLFLPGGARREEALFMSDVVRKNSMLTLTDAERTSEQMVCKILEGARSGKVKREKWEATVTELIAGGDVRRGHLLCLIEADVLREVGFTASELLAADFPLPTLRMGGYTAADMRAIGLKANELGAAGFSSAQLKGGGYSAKELKLAGYSPRQMKEGGYLAKQLKAVGLSAAELKENGYTAEELRIGTFSVKELRPLGYSAAELRGAGFDASVMRDVDFSLAELKEGGCVRGASRWSQPPSLASPRRNSGTSGTSHPFQSTPHLSHLSPHTPLMLRPRSPFSKVHRNRHQDGKVRLIADAGGGVHRLGDEGGRLLALGDAHSGVLGERE